MLVSIIGGAHLRTRRSLGLSFRYPKCLQGWNFWGPLPSPDRLCWNQLVLQNWAISKLFQSQSRPSGAVWHSTLEYLSIHLDRHVRSTARCTMKAAASRLSFVIDYLTLRTIIRSQSQRCVSGAIHKCRLPSSDMLGPDATQGPRPAQGGKTTIPYPSEVKRMTGGGVDTQVVGMWMCWWWGGK